MTTPDRWKSWWWPGLGLAVVALFAARVSGHPDAWTAAALGRRYLEAGFPRTDPLLFGAPDAAWLDASWLHSVVMSLLWRMDAASWSGVLHLAAVVAGFALLIPVVRPWCRGPALLALFCLTGLLLDPGLLHSPDAFAVAFLGWTLWVAHRPRPLKPLLLLLLPAQVLWVNMHPSFLLGPLILGLCLWERREPAVPGDALATRLRPWIPVAALLAVAVLNPYGLRLLAWTLGEARLALLEPSLTEGVLGRAVPPFGTPTHAGFSWRVVVNLSYAVAGLGLLTERQRLPFAVAVLAGLAAATAIFRPLLIRPVYAVLMFPMLALSVGSALRMASEQARRMFGSQATKVPAVGGAAAGLLALVVLGAAMAPGPAGHRPGLAPALRTSPAVAGVLDRVGPVERPLHLAVDGGPLAWSRPGHGIYADLRPRRGAGRAGLSATRPFGGDRDLTDLAVQARADALVINAHWPTGPVAIAVLRRDPAWALVWFDGEAAVFLPMARAQAQAAAIPGLRQEGLDRLDQTFRAYQAGPDPDRAAALFTAAEVFRETEDFPRAAALYQALVDGGEPPSAAVEAGLGVCALAQGQSTEAVRHLERSAALEPRFARTWRLLAQAYEAAGEPRKAEAARRRGEALTPND